MKQEGPEPIMNDAVRTHTDYENQENRLMIIKLAQATCRIRPVHPPESLYVGLSALDFEAHRTWGCAPGLVYFGPSALFAAAQPPAGASLIITYRDSGLDEAESRMTT